PPDISLANSRWQVFGPTAPVIQNLALHAVASPVQSYSGAVLDTGVTDATIVVDWIPGGPETWGGLLVRYQDPANFLIARYYHDAIALYRCVNGGFTLLGIKGADGTAGRPHRPAGTPNGPTLAV